MVVGESSGLASRRPDRQRGDVPPVSMKRLVPVIALLLTGIFVFAALAQPLNSLVGRLLILGALGAFGIALFAAIGRRRKLRIAVIALAAALGAALFLPGWEPDAGRLRERYLTALPRYVGTPYVWGGERRSGIDCSGLPRKAMQDALFAEGLTTFNPHPIRQALALWWNDASAQALRDGYRNYVFPLSEEGRIRETAFHRVQPGDIAITDTGTHCLVFLRDGVWIQADPGDGKVRVYEAAKSDNTWFSSAVGLYRWSAFKGL